MRLRIEGREPGNDCARKITYLEDQRDKVDEQNEEKSVELQRVGVDSWLASEPTTITVHGNLLRGLPHDLKTHVAGMPRRCHRSLFLP